MIATAHPGDHPIAALSVVSDFITVRPGERWSSPSAAGPARLVPFVAVTIAAHVAVIMLAVWSAPVRIGAGAGEVDGIAVEMIDLATFDSRTRALTGDARDTPAISQPETPATPAAPPAASPPAPPSEPAPAPASVAPAKPQAAAPPSSQRAATPQVLSAPFNPTFTVPEAGKPARTAKLDLDAKLPSAAQPRQRQAEPGYAAAEFYLDRRSRAGKPRLGEVDHFIQAVQRIVERVKPRSPSVSGQVIIGFVISPTGVGQEFTLVKSSGSTALDTLVMEAVRGATLLLPPPTASLRDRTFEVTYNYY